MDTTLAEMPTISYELPAKPAKLPSPGKLLSDLGQLYQPVLDRMRANPEVFSHLDYLQCMQSRDRHAARLLSKAHDRYHPKATENRQEAERLRVQRSRAVKARQERIDNAAGRLANEKPPQAKEDA